ncbi:protein-L-isoaspartate O-methyltransferase family protein [Dongia sedimenti]|uniref:Protein-L-isoaspartate O-methyltransferase n=1 Tax=Dongia sedimenti TaxID=3064282 RepID=A0ABU0YKF9_9PROT|nr:protein-L-isoaspartate O-methyltransferase [Rhodospirillaceae bacterium R-7]
MDYAAARQHMIDSQIKTNKVTDPSVIEALAALPREAFVAEAQRKLAYIDRPVAIGAGRRMTEPMVLARLLQSAHLKGGETVLVVGAGTGYSAAILSRLVKKVVALESAPELADRAKAILAQLGVSNVAVVAGDLGAGRPADGPYDFILVDGAAEIVPDALTAQLADRGRLAVVIKDQGIVGRGTILTKADGVVTPRAVFDADAEVLPGFTRPQRFVF